MIVVDTDVVSYLFKLHPLADPFISALEGHRLFVSFMTLAEIEHGMLRAKWGERLQHRMHRHLEKYEVVNSTRELCRLWSMVMEESASKGRRISPEDAWIAATALRLNLPLATNNRKHFAHLDRLKFILVLA